MNINAIAIGMAERWKRGEPITMPAISFNEFSFLMQLIREMTE